MVFLLIFVLPFMQFFENISEMHKIENFNVFKLLSNIHCLAFNKFNLSSDSIEISFLLYVSKNH